MEFSSIGKAAMESVKEGANGLLGSLDFGGIFDDLDLVDLTKGTGELLGGLGNVYQAFKTSEYRDELLRMEDEQYQYEKERRDKRQEEYEKSLEP